MDRLDPQEAIRARKASIRDAMRAWRRQLPVEAARERSRHIAERVMALPAFRAATALLSYVSVKENEAGTVEIIRSVLAEGRPVLVPITEAGRSMTWSRLRALEHLAPAAFGVLEPASGFREIMTPPEGSVCLVPGLAFTVDGDRIGFGGGYFDRFLADFPGVSIALAFEEQMTHFTPGPHDVPVDIIATDSTLYLRDSSAFDEPL